MTKTDRKSIWNLKQNRPSLVAKDLEALGIESEIAYQILLNRGIFKWLSVRRKLIKLKLDWKGEVSGIIQKIRQAKDMRDPHRLFWLRGYLAAKEGDVASVKKLCHSDRWQAPDNDRKAIRFLEGMEEK